MRIHLADGRNRVVIAEPRINDFGEILRRIRLIKNIFKLHRSYQEHIFQVKFIRGGKKKRDVFNFFFF